MARGDFRFVHLRSRSPYSLLEGALKLKPLAARCAEYRMPALALTDTHNMCGALEFSNIMTGAGIQPIIGLTLSVDIGGADQPGALQMLLRDMWLICVANIEKSGTR